MKREVYPEMEGLSLSRWHSTPINEQTPKARPVCILCGSAQLTAVLPETHMERAKANAWVKEDVGYVDQQKKTKEKLCQ